MLLLVIFEVSLLRMFNRCLQRLPIIPARQVQVAVNLTPSIVKITVYGEASDPCTKNSKVVVFILLSFDLKFHRVNFAKSSHQ